jgi:hypothetical protein
VKLHRGAGVVGAAGGVRTGERVAEPDHGGVGHDEILEPRQVLPQLAGWLGEAIHGPSQRTLQEANGLAGPVVEALGRPVSFPHPSSSPSWRLRDGCNDRETSM